MVSEHEGPLRPLCPDRWCQGRSGRWIRHRLSGPLPMRLLRLRCRPQLPLQLQLYHLSIPVPQRAVLVSSLVYRLAVYRCRQEVHHWPTRRAHRYQLPACLYQMPHDHQYQLLPVLPPSAHQQ